MKMDLQNFVKIKNKVFGCIFTFFTSISVFSEDTPLPEDTPQSGYNVAAGNAAGPPPPPPAPIDDFIVPMIFIALLIAYYFVYKKSNKHIV